VKFEADKRMIECTIGIYVTTIWRAGIQAREDMQNSEWFTCFKP
jgi:hypothetical protein